MGGGTSLRRGSLKKPCKIGGGEAVTLEFVVADYLDHMENHLRQITSR